MKCEIDVELMLRHIAKNDLMGREKLFLMGLAKQTDRRGHNLCSADTEEFYCSECGFDVVDWVGIGDTPDLCSFTYCPNCGVKIDVNDKMGVNDNAYTVEQG